jgi:hypothetical protein
VAAKLAEADPMRVVQNVGEVNRIQVGEGAHGYGDEVAVLLGGVGRPLAEGIGAKTLPQ